MPNRDGALRPGAFASAEIVTSADQPAVLVPASADRHLRRHREGPRRRGRQGRREAGADRPAPRGRRSRSSKGSPPARPWSSSPATWWAARPSASRADVRGNTHAKARRNLHPPAGLRRHADPGAGSSGAAGYFRLGRRPLPLRGPADRQRAHEPPGRLARRGRVGDLPAHRGGRQHGRGHQRAALGLGPGQLVRHRHLRPRARHRRRGAGRAGPRRRGRARSAPGRSAAGRRQVRQRLDAGADRGAVGRPARCAS